MAKADITQAEGDLFLENITKQFGDFRAVNDLSLQVPQGLVLRPARPLRGVERPPHCGWSPDSRIRRRADPDRRCGHHLRQAHNRPVNTVFQNYALFPHMDIFENVAFGLKRRGIKDAKQQVDEALDLIQLSQVAKRKPLQLSGGQQQRSGAGPRDRQPAFRAAAR